MKCRTVGALMDFYILEVHPLIDAEIVLGTVGMVDDFDPFHKPSAARSATILRFSETTTGILQSVW